MSFDKDGSFITQYGERGRSSSEYVRVNAFDVDRHYVYLYDDASEKNDFIYPWWSIRPKGGNTFLGRGLQGFRRWFILVLVEARKVKCETLHDRFTF